MLGIIFIALSVILFIARIGRGLNVNFAHRELIGLSTLSQLGSDLTKVELSCLKVLSRKWLLTVMDAISATMLIGGIALLIL